MQIFQLKVSPVRTSRYSFLNNTTNHYYVSCRPTIVTTPKIEQHKSLMEMSLDEIGILLNKKKRKHVLQ